MGAPTWTKEEDRILTLDRRDGRKFHEIAPKLGRTKKACMARYAVLSNDPGIYMANAAQDEIRLASALLREATLSYFCRVANKSGKGMEQVIESVLGKEPAPKAPGTETALQHSSVERLYGMAA